VGVELETAVSIIRYRGRRLYGKLYLLWSIYSVLIHFVNSVLSGDSATIVTIVLFILFIYVTIRDVSIALASATKAAGLLMRKRDIVARFKAPLIALFAATVMALLADIYGASTASLVSSTVASAMIAYFILLGLAFGRFRLADPQYFDYMAIVAILVMPLSTVFEPLIYLIEAAWIYAGLASLMWANRE